MIKSIGMDKVLIILLVAAFAIGGYFYNTNILAPSIVKKERELRSTKSRLSTLTTDTNKLIAGVDLFERQKEEFIIVQKSGFFDDQNRVATRSKLDAIGRDSQLEILRYSISPAQNISNQKLKDAGYKILETSIDIEIGAISDTDIQTFLFYLNHGFPGQVIINNIDMSKEQDLTQPLLRNIGLKTDYDPLITANISMVWKTMVPDTSVQTQTDSGL